MDWIDLTVRSFGTCVVIAGVALLVLSFRKKQQN